MTDLAESTFDTYRILVLTLQADQAVQAWTAASHHVTDEVVS